MNLKNDKIFIYNLIFSPQNAIAYSIKSKEDEHIGIAILVLITSIVFNLLSRVIISMKISLINTFIGIGGFITILNFTGNLMIFTAVIYFIKSFSLSSKSSNFSKKNQMPGNKNYALLLFKLLCFSFIPFIFTPVVSLMGLFLSLHNCLAMYYIIKVGIYFWIVFLQILIIKKLFDLKLLTSIALYVLPLVGLNVFIFIKIFNFALSVFSKIL